MDEGTKQDVWVLATAEAMAAVIFASSVAPVKLAALTVPGIPGSVTNSSVAALELTVCPMAVSNSIDGAVMLTPVATVALVSLVIVPLVGTFLYAPLVH